MPVFFRFAFFRLFVIFMVVCIWPVAALSQYFGRNKVQYEEFKFKIINTEHFQVYFYPKESDAVYDAAQMLERWYLRYVNLLGYQLSITQPVIVYANHADFQQTNVISGLIPQGTGGVTEGLKNRIVLPFTGTNQENNHVLGHELVHGFQYDVMKSMGQGLRASRRMPLWFVEGMAEYLSVGREGRLTSMWMRDALLFDDLPPIKKISRSYKYFPYRYGHAIWAFLAGKYGDEMVPAIYNAVLGNGWNQGMEQLLGVPADSLSKEWQQDIRNKYEPQLEGRTHPKDVGDPLFTGKGGTNLSPVISPDGKYFAFLSRKDVFTLDLYMADAETGEIIKKLVSSGTEPHFDALRFMNSAGAWAPDSKSFAFVVFKKGDNAIALLDVESGDVEETITLPRVDGITYLAWSPDGERLAVAGTIGGISNMFLLDLEERSYEQLTDDRYSEIQPAWSPDGQTLAFATDRGPETNLEYHDFGPINIALMDIETQEIQIIGLPGASKHITPQFSETGDIYCVADPDGFSDIYRYSISENQFYRITRVATGISGLTELSPAMSYSANGRLVFSVFENTNYNIYSLSGDALVGKAYPADLAESSMVLPPNNDPDDIVPTVLNKKQIGFELRPGYEINDYHPNLELLYVGQSGVGVVVNRFGTGLGGGVNMVFSDLLGNHVLYAAVQASGTLKDIGGQALYQNRDKRINWGGGLSHIPYRRGFVTTSPDTVTIEGEQFLARDVTLVQERQFYDQISFTSSLPLNQNQRFEGSAGYTRLSYDREARTQTVLGGRILDETTQDLDAPDPINLYQASLAFVGDYSFQGFTSPVRGRAYRFEVEPTFGGYRFISGLADYRKYFFMNPITVAFRGMYYGRYYGNERSDRLTPLFLGYETWVRGYSGGSFSFEECNTAEEDGRCASIDRLIGTRVAVLNAEVRMPLFGTERYGLINFQYLPTELFLFGDAGVAWTQEEEPELKFERDSKERVPVFSAGAGARFNLFGYIVMQVYYAYPFQRPQKGAHFGFVIAPGW